MIGAPSEEEVATFLHARFVGVEGTSLRLEERTKVRELVGMLAAIARLVRTSTRKRTFVLVDAAAGKGYVGLAASELVLRPLGRDHRVVFVERDARRAAMIAAAAREADAPAEVRVADCRDRDAYPEAPSLVCALHACGDASDGVLASAIDRHAARVLVVPCCVGNSVVDAAAGRAALTRLGLPTSAPIVERIVHGVVDGRRLLRLEAAGYESRAITIAPPTVTPYHVALEGRLVGDPVRIRRARESLAFSAGPCVGDDASSAASCTEADALPRGECRSDSRDS